MAIKVMARVPSIRFLLLLTSLLSFFQLPVESTHTTFLQSSSYTQLNETFIDTTCDDSVEFQTLLNNVTICAQPSSLTVDNVDSNIFFLTCRQWILRFNSQTVSNNKPSYSVRSIGPYAPAFTQLPVADGHLLIPGSDSQYFDGTFHLADRLGLSPLVSFTPRGDSPLQYSRVSSIVVDDSIEQSSGTSVVYFVNQGGPTTLLKRMRINYLALNDSVVELVQLQLIDPNPSFITSLTILPKLHQLLVVAEYFVAEFNLLTNATRTVFNVSDPSISSEHTYIVQIETTYAGTGSYVMFVSLESKLVFRVHPAAGVWELVVTPACSNSVDIYMHMHLNPITNVLYIGCDRVIAAVFNGSVSDPSTTAAVRYIADASKCSPIDFVSRFKTDTKFDRFQLFILCLASLIVTSGTNLTPTISQVMCMTPRLISSQLDEFGRHILLHDCGFGYFPTVTVDGNARLLTSLCSKLNSVFHRPGTSEVYARCSGPSRIYVARTRTDNSNPQQLFTCPTYSTISKYSGGSTTAPDPASFTAQAAIAGNSSVITVCDKDVWMIPLASNSGSTRMLMNLSDPTTAAPFQPINSVHGIQVSTRFVFASVVATISKIWLDRIVAVELEIGKITSINGFNLFIDEPQNALWYDTFSVAGGGYDQWLIFRQQPLDDFSSNALQVFVNVSSLRVWTVDVPTNSLIVLLPEAGVQIFPAYNTSIVTPTHNFTVTPGCISHSFGTPTGNLVAHHDLGLLLLACDATSDWSVAGLSLDVLVNSSATVDWIPLLRSTSQCGAVDGFLLEPSTKGYYLHCNSGDSVISQFFSTKFQCAGGEQWFLGDCESCISGWSKSVESSWVASSSFAPAPSLVIPQCVQCIPGSIAVSPASFVCLPCSVGTYHDTSLGEVCRPCPIGSYQNMSGTTECLSCEIGMYAPSQGSVSCSTCPLGSVPDARGVTCVACPKDSYAPSSISPQCVSCEGPHQEGLECSNGLASVKEGYFAFLVNEADGSVVSPTATAVGVFHSAACAYGFCHGSPLQVSDSSANSSTVTIASSCSIDDPQPGPIHYCCWPRLNSPDNLLCANCVDGYIAWSSTCAACPGTNGGLITVLIIFAIALIAWLYSNAGSSSSTTASDTNTSGHVTILLYFVQISSLQLGRASDWLQWTHWSNLSTSSTRGCIVPIDAYQQTAMNLAVPLLLTSIMLVMAVIHLVFDRWIKKPSDDYLRDTDPDDDAWSKHDHASINVNRRRSSLQEAFLESGKSHDSTHELQDMAFEERKLQHDSHRNIPAWVNNPSTFSVTSEQMDSLWSPLSGGYSTSAWYWNGFVLLRRVLFSTCAVFLADSPTTRLPVLSLMHLFSLLIHLLASPYSMPRLNLVESGSYILLLVVSILLSMQSPPYPTWFEIVIVTAVSVATTGMIVWIAYTKFRRSRGKNDPENRAHSSLSQACSKLAQLLRAVITPPTFSHRRYFRTFLLVLLFCYTSVTSTVLSFLHCVDVASDVRLVFDSPSIDCRSERYHMYRVWSIIVLIVYTIGLPVATVAILAFKRR